MAEDSLNELIRLVLSDNALDPDQKKMLIDELRKSSPGTADRWTYRWAILILGATILASVGFTFFLKLHNVDIPDGLTSIGSTALGGLAGLLVPSRGSSQA